MIFYKAFCNFVRKYTIKIAHPMYEVYTEYCKLAQLDMTSMFQEYKIKYHTQFYISVVQCESLLANEIKFK